MNAARRKQRQQQRTDRQRGRFTLLGEHARNVALLDVADFVSDHRRQFRFGLRDEDESAVHADEAPGNANALIIGSRMQKKVKSMCRALLAATSW